MAALTLPVRYYDHPMTTISLHPDETAFMLVDCNGSIDRHIAEAHLAPALMAARRRGLRVFYFYEAGYGIGGGGDITRELHGTRYGKDLAPELFTELDWHTAPPHFLPAVAPQPNEPVFAKTSKDGFQTTNADYYLRTYGITTIVAVGFALRSCLYHTCLGARHRNFRIILLRDCTTPAGKGEFPDTIAADNPEGGWMRFVFLRQFETTIGYTSTASEFADACSRSAQTGNFGPADR